jgi:hypothetical protein
LERQTTPRIARRARVRDDDAAGRRPAIAGGDRDARTTATISTPTRASFVSFLDAHREDAHAVDGPAAHRET